MGELQAIGANMNKISNKGKYSIDNHREQGIALTVMLVVLMFAATLSFGTLFLTQNNLKVAENIRNHAIAKYNAEAGIEVSNIMLGDSWKNTGIMPTTDTVENLVPLAISASGTEFEYYLDPSVFNTTSNNIYLAIVGQSGPNANYTSEMLANAVPAATGHTRLLPAYEHGILSKKHVRMNQMQGTVMTSAGVHGNQGFTIYGDLNTVLDCITYDEETGDCTETAEAVNKEMYFTAAFDQDSYTCIDPRGDNLCVYGKPKTLVYDPFNPWMPDGQAKNPQPAIISSKAALLKGLVAQDMISGERLQRLGYLADDAETETVSLLALADTNRDGVYNTDPNYGPVDSDIDITAAIDHICSSFGVKTFDGSEAVYRSSDLYDAGFRGGKTVCITKADGLDIPRRANLSDVKIINLSGQLRIFSGSILDNTVIVSLGNEALEIGDSTINDSLIYAEADLTFQKTVSIEGTSSLLSASNLTMNNELLQETTDGRTVAGINAVSDENMTINKDGVMYGVFQTKGNYTNALNADVKGSIVAEGEIIFQKSITAVDSSLPMENPTLEVVEGETIEAGFVMMGRR